MFGKKSGRHFQSDDTYLSHLVESLEEDKPLLLEEEETTPLPNNAPHRVLTVGAETLLKGDISDCDCLRIEGNAEVNVTNVQRLEVNESGIFNGSAIVEEAYIKGQVNGAITVTGKLHVHEHGKISGKVIYASLEIEHGGEMSGEISLYTPDTRTSGPSSKKTSEARSTFAERFAEEVDAN